MLVVGDEPVGDGRGLGGDVHLDGSEEAPGVVLRVGGDEMDSPGGTGDADAAAAAVKGLAAPLVQMPDDEYR